MTYNKAAEKAVLPLIEVVNQLDPTNLKSSCSCLAYIIDIDIGHNYSWFYASCSKCKSKAYKKGAKVFCLEHGTVQPSYRFTTTITDVNNNTMTTKVLFFDETISSMINMSCHTMVVDHKNVDPHVQRNHLIDGQYELSHCGG